MQVNEDSTTPTLAVVEMPIFSGFMFHGAAEITSWLYPKGKTSGLRALIWISLDALLTGERQHRDITVAVRLILGSALTGTHALPILSLLASAGMGARGSQ